MLQTDIKCFYACNWNQSKISLGIVPKELIMEVPAVHFLQAVSHTTVRLALKTRHPLNVCGLWTQLPPFTVLCQSLSLVLFSFF